MFFCLTTPFFFSFFNFFFFLFNYREFFSFSIRYFPFFFDYFSNFGVVVGVRFFRGCFGYMVFLVMYMVSCYRSYYLDYYNNKKFFFLILMFFFSIIGLCVFNSSIFFIIGWDGLGVASILLVIFYPNSSSYFNSFLTIFFNRLGDVSLLIFIFYFFCNPCHFFFLFSYFEDVLFFMGLFCLFCKRAQFPFSRWLPAAISAPTPISAMVHSSTLVTAGIFFFLVFIDVFVFLGFSVFVLFFSVLTFFLGGWGASLEYDLKKIVAFSTMSQVRMIFFFFCNSLFFYGISHIINHAFFKTLIFLCSGSAFMVIFRNQMKLWRGSISSLIMVKFYFFFRVFSIRGLHFSRSFYRKDLVLEHCSVTIRTFLFFFMVTGRVLTLLYSWGLYSLCFSWVDLKKYHFSKYFFYFSFFLIFLLISFLFDFYLFFRDFPPLINFFDFIVILYMMLVFLFLSTPKWMVLAKSVFYTKNFFFGYNFYLFFAIRSLFHNDHFFFKPSFFRIKLFHFNSPIGVFIH